DERDQPPSPPLSPFCSLLPTTMRFMPTCTERFFPSTVSDALPLTYQPKLPVENSRGSATMGKPPTSILSGSALARKSARVMGHVVLGGMGADIAQHAVAQTFPRAGDATMIGQWLN